MMNNKKYTCPYYACNQAIQGEVRNQLGIGCNFTAKPPYEEKTSEKTDNHHHAEASYGQMDERYLEKFRMHKSFSIPAWAGTGFRMSIVGFSFQQPSANFHLRF